jgi:ketosteroid isomerase-like protein
MMKSIYGVVVVLLLAGPHSEAQTLSAAEQEVLKVENDWNQALVKRDAGSLQQFYADEYLYTDPDGLVWDKARDLANLTSGSAARLSAYKLDETRVHMYGDVAVVTGRNTIKGVFERVYSDVSGAYRFTDVFVKRNGRWQCIASQASRIVERKKGS